MRTDIEEAIENEDILCLYKLFSEVARDEQILIRDMISDISLEKLDESFLKARSLDIKDTEDHAILHGVYDHAYLCLEQANYEEAKRCLEMLADISSDENFSLAMRKIEAVTYKEVDMPNFFKYYCEETASREDFYYTVFKEELDVLVAELKLLKS